MNNKLGGIKVSILRDYLREQGIADESPYIVNGFLTQAGLQMFNTIERQEHTPAEPYYFEVRDIFGNSYSFSTYERAVRGGSLMVNPYGIYKIYANGDHESS